MKHIKIRASKQNTNSYSYTSKFRNYPPKTQTPSDAGQRAEAVAGNLSELRGEILELYDLELFDIEPGLLLTFIVDRRYGAGEKAEEYFEGKCDIRNIDTYGEHQLAITVFAKDGELLKLIRLFSAYGDEDQLKKDSALVEATREVYKTVFEVVYNGDPDYCTYETQQPVWLQIWVPARFGQTFIEAAKRSNIKVDDFSLRFAERAVILLKIKPARL